MFSRFPAMTWRQDAVWRRQAARTFDDLAADLQAGQWPRPTCPAEEMALHLVLEAAPDAVADSWGGIPSLLPMPEHDNDFDWDMISEVFFQDHDILDLFSPGLDGAEDPDTDHNKALGIGDYRPQAWFTTFLNMTRRDPRRPFRR